jgi:hypothetical protein
VARHDDAHAVELVACQLDALDAAALADGEARMTARPLAGMLSAPLLGADRAKL